MCFNCELSALIWGYLIQIRWKRCRNYNSLHMCLPLVKGPKSNGTLASQLFHGQVCVIPSLSQLQWADKGPEFISSVLFAIWNLLLSTIKMRSKELSLSVKQAIIRLKKQNKPIREIAKTLGVAKTTVWNILKKKERTGALSNTKRPGRPRKTTVVDDRLILSLVKKTPLHNSWPDQEHSPGGRCMLCQSQQSREDFTRVNTEGSPQDVNHWWASKTGRPD